VRIHAPIEFVYARAIARNALRCSIDAVDARRYCEQTGIAADRPYGVGTIRNVLVSAAETRNPGQN
jgi:hypothetical protein